MEPAQIIREWARRRWSLQIVHAACAIGILATLFGSEILDEYGVLDIPVWIRVAVVAALVIVDLAFIQRVCRCPNCGEYPGVRSTLRGRSTRMPLPATGMAPFAWAVCLKCKAALRDD